MDLLWFWIYRGTKEDMKPLNQIEVIDIFRQINR